MTAAEEQEMVEFLERDQLVTDTSRPLGRMALSHRTVVALWALRVFAIVVSAMVIYTFASQLTY
ncbi:MAG TPA: hypothetical protein VG186_05140 [Solirubrobacteraceae bacterium]|nr:hypothetical protein [Solirubrobacteraceae bacterium]